MQIKSIIKIIFSLVILLSQSEGQAQQKFKVRKVKGQQAVIDFTGVLVPGQTYSVDDEASENIGISASDRNYFFDITAGFSNYKSDISGTDSVTEVEVGSTFGWNWGTYELGPAIVFDYRSTGGVTTSTILGGAYGDWNVIPNISGEPFIYGASAFVAGGQISDGTRDLSLMRVQPGVFTKWFLGGSNTGFRLNLFYRLDKYFGQNSNSSANGIGGSISLIQYF